MCSHSGSVGVRGVGISAVWHAAWFAPTSTARQWRGRAGVYRPSDRRTSRQRGRSPESCGGHHVRPNAAGLFDRSQRHRGDNLRIHADTAACLSVLPRSPQASIRRLRYPWRTRRYGRHRVSGNPCEYPRIAHRPPVRASLSADPESHPRPWRQWLLGE